MNVFKFIVAATFAALAIAAFAVTDTSVDATTPTLPVEMVNMADQIADVDSIVADICEQVRYAIGDDLDLDGVLTLRLGEYVRTHPDDDSYGLTYYHGVVVGCYEALTAS